ncbi:MULTISPECIES: hypothetical protein [unclassified Phyllobacterium]|uniref:hypothetical protein n=1 Tax=unclassified Phyllobacterium TaxID=2638441 RepID=UPI003012EDF1
MDPAVVPDGWTIKAIQDFASSWIGLILQIATLIGILIGCVKVVRTWLTTTPAYERKNLGPCEILTLKPTDGHFWWIVSVSADFVFGVPQSFTDDGYGNVVPTDVKQTKKYKPSTKSDTFCFQTPGGFMEPSPDCRFVFKVRRRGYFRVRRIVMYVRQMV